jgi:hypothetical protein
MLNRSKITAEKTNEVGKLSIKNLAIGFSHFITRRGKLVVLLIALVTVIFLVVLLSGYMLFDITSNYQSNITIPNQGKIIFPNQSSSNSSNPSETTVSNAGALKTSASKFIGILA